MVERFRIHITSGPKRAGRIAVVLAVLSLSGGALTSGMIAMAQAPASWSCSESGTHDANQGVNMTPRHVVWTLSSKLTACQIPDSSIRSGTAKWSEAGTFICPGGVPGTLAPAEFSIVWDNGKEGTGTLNPYNPGLAPLASTTGEVTGGEFAGAQVVEVHTHYVNNPADLFPCGAGGVKRVLHQGTISFYFNGSSPYAARRSATRAVK